MKRKRGIMPFLVFFVLFILFVGYLTNFQSREYDIEMERDVDVYASISQPENGSSFSVGQGVAFNGTGSSTWGSIESFSWSFGDGDTSNSQNPVHSYSIPQTYTVQLTVEDTGGYTASTSIEIHIIEGRPTVQITEPINGDIFPRNFPVNFSGDAIVSSGYIAEYKWTFADGTTSSQKSPVHQFNTTGVKTNKFEAKDSFGNWSDPMYVTISISLPTAQILSPSDGSTVYANTGIPFSGIGHTTHGIIAGWNWSFGDGAISTLQNPNHTYTNNGEFTVTLQVTDQYGNTSAPVSIMLQVKTTPPTAIIMKPANQGSYYINIPVEFDGYGTVSEPNTTIVGYEWIFGDGSSSEMQRPTHIYTSMGQKEVKFRVEDGNGEKSDWVTISINILAEIPVAYITTPDDEFTIFINTAVSFSGYGQINSGTITAYEWKFGDGQSSIVQNPKHTYESAGTKEVQFRVRSDSGVWSDPVKIRVIVLMTHAPVASFTYTPNTGLNESTNITFTAKCTDEDNDIREYQWFHNGKKLSETGLTFTMRFVAGTHTIRLVCIDSVELMGEYETTFTVGLGIDNLPPVAKFIVLTPTITDISPTTLQDQSTDPEGDVLTRQWYIDDQLHDETESMISILFQPGTHKVEIVVQDTIGQKANFSQLITCEKSDSPQGYVSDGSQQNNTILMVLGVVIAGGAYLWWRRKKSKGLTSKRFRFLR